MTFECKKEQCSFYSTAKALRLSGALAIDTQQLSAPSPEVICESISIQSEMVLGTNVDCGGAAAELLHLYVDENGRLNHAS